MRTRALAATGLVAFSLLTMGQDSCQPTTTNTPDTTGGASATAEQTPANQQAAVGDPITLTGSEEGVKVQVTVLGVIDPAVGGEYDSVTAGKRRVGIRLALRNVGTVAYQDAPSNSGKLLTTTDEQGQSTFVSGGVCSGNFVSSVTLSPGSREQGCLPFEIPKGAQLKKFQFALNSGFGPQTGEWAL